MKRILLIALIASVISNIYLKIFDVYFHLSSIEYHLLGRWILECMLGKIFVSDIYTIPAYSDEECVGIIIHLVIACLFSSLYVFFLKYFFSSKYEILVGVSFSLLLVIIPLGFEATAMGEGFFFSNTPQPLFSCCKVLGYHFAFGLGLGCGNALYRYFFQRLS